MSNLHRLKAPLGDEVEETELAGATAAEQTFYAGNFGSDIVIVTDQAVRLISGSKAGLIAEWRHPASKAISVVTANPVGRQIMAASGRELFYLEVGEKPKKYIQSLLALK